MKTTNRTSIETNQGKSCTSGTRNRLKRLISAFMILLSFFVGEPSFVKGSEMQNGDYVVILHGLARGPGSMKKMASFLESAGYIVINVSYPSTSMTVEELVRKYPGEAISKQCKDPHKKINFVTHSLGGILVRKFLEREKLQNLGRVVMLAPPNNGSELVDKLSWLPPFRLIFGPSGMELGTDPGSIPARLGPVDYETGIIAGNFSINPLASALIPGKDDGKVSVENTKIDNMTDFVEVACSHTFIMRDRKVMELTLRFLKTGSFDINHGYHND